MKLESFVKVYNLVNIIKSSGCWHLLLNDSDSGSYSRLWAPVTHSRTAIVVVIHGCDSLKNSDSGSYLVVLTKPFAAGPI